MFFKKGQKISDTVFSICFLTAIFGRIVYQGMTFFSKDRRLMEKKGMLLKFQKRRLKTIPQQIVEFKWGEKIFGVEIAQIVEIISLKNLSQIPEGNDFLKGVVNIRGNVLPIVDTRKKFGFGDTEITSNSRAIITSFSELHVGILVDWVNNSLRQTAGAKIDEKAVHDEFVQFVIKGDDFEIPIVKIEKLLSDEELKSLEKLTKNF